MAGSSRLKRGIGFRTADVAILRNGYAPLATDLTRIKQPAELSTAELAFRIVAAFRAHPHISNVLTHISRSNWGGVERSLSRILDLATLSDDLSLLEQNIIDLMCAERGITGKILKPYFHAILQKLVLDDRAEGLLRHIQTLFAEVERRVLNSTTTNGSSEEINRMPEREHAGEDAKWRSTC